MARIFLRCFRLKAILLGSLLFWAIPSFSAEIFRWTDEKGTVHFTDEFAKVPLRYRDQVKRSEVAETPANGEEKRVEPASGEGSERVRRYLEAIERKIEVKKELESSIAKLEEEKGICERRIQEIERYEKEYFNSFQPVKNPLTGRWVPVGSPYYDEKRRLTARVEALRKELAVLEEKLLEVVRSL